MSLDKRDAATRAVDKLIEQGLLDKFQKYNIAQVIREEYAADNSAIPRAQIEKLEEDFRKDAKHEVDAQRMVTAAAVVWGLCADRLSALLHPELKGEDK